MRRRSNNGDKLITTSLTKTTLHGHRPDHGHQPQFSSNFKTTPLRRRGILAIAPDYHHPHSTSSSNPPCTTESRPDHGKPGVLPIDIVRNPSPSSEANDFLRRRARICPRVRPTRHSKSGPYRARLGRVLCPLHGLRSSRVSNVYSTCVESHPRAEYILSMSAWNAILAWGRFSLNVGVNSPFSTLNSSGWRCTALTCSNPLSPAPSPTASMLW